MRTHLLTYSRLRLRRGGWLPILLGLLLGLAAALPADALGLLAPARLAAAPADELPVVSLGSVNYAGAGYINVAGGYASGTGITDKGVLFGTNSVPDFNNSRLYSNGSGTGLVGTTISGAQRGTTYYARAYATNAQGTSYSAIGQVTTPNPPPSVTDTNGAPNLIAENAPAGTVVSGLMVAAGDSYGSYPLTLRSTNLTNDAGGRFVLGEGGTLATAFAYTIKVAPGAVLDYETATSYTITVRVDGGSAGVTNQDFVINLTDVNEFAPVVTTTGGTTTAPELVTTVIDPGVTVNDADGAKTLVSATVRISGGLVSSQDALSSTPSGNISTSYNPATGVLTLTSPAPNATLAQWQAVLRSVSYRNSSTLPTGATRTISFQVSDGTFSSAIATKTLAIQDIPNPTITNLAPSIGAVGTNVIITGTNLTGATGVSFNGVAATSFVVNSATQLTATVPAGATSGPLAVTTPTGTATSPQAFTVVTPLVVTSTSPTRNTNVAPRSTNVALTYSQPVTAANTPAVRVFSQQSGGIKAGTTTTSGSTVTVDPAVDFKPGETVLVTSVGSATARPYVYQFTTKAGVGPGTFSPGADPSVGRRPQSVALGDVDGDGDLDLVTANGGTNTMSVRLNGGDASGSNTGTFSGGSDPSVGDTPYSVALGDVDGDGDLDLLTANKSSNTVSVRLNGGTNTGTFNTGSDVPVGSGSTSVALGDIDGDGDLDLLTANVGNSGSVSVRLNGGDASGSNTGTFSGGSDVAVGRGPLSVALGDVDGDGDLDLLTANANGTNTVSVRLNGGDASGSNTGTFSGGSDVPVGSGPFSVAVGDVDGDGDLDLLTANYGTGTVSVRLNGGTNTGTFSTGSDPSVGSNPYNVALGDVDGDGDLDLVTANGGTNTVSVRLNGGDASGSNTGTFSGGSDPSVGSNPYSVALGDVDGDGDLDLLTANANISGSVSVRLNQVPCTAPSAVALGTLTPTSAQVTFTGNGTASGGYTATAMPTSGGTPVSVTGPASPLTLTGLAPNTAYTVVVSSLCTSSLTATSSPPVAFITPCEKPVLTVPAAQSLAADAGQCSATRTFAASATGTPTPTLSYTVGGTPITFPYAFPVGTTTVTVTARNSCNDTDTKDFKVQVQDLQAPVVRTQNVTVALVNGQATITAAQVNNGSSDNCTIKSLSLDKTSFTCDNIGTNQVTLTVTDASGNASTALATVTVTGTKPTPSISVSPSTTLYLGYGPQTATLTASGGGPGATYSWNPDTYLSATASAATTFTATKAGSFTYTVTVTSASGCAATASTTLTVVDARCGNKNDKVIVCHKGMALCIGADGVQDHLNHGDQLGACPSKTQQTSALIVASVAANEAVDTTPLLEAYPNPFTASTTVRFRATQDGAVKVQVYDALGRLVTTLYDEATVAGQVVERPLGGANLAAGLYTIRLTGNSQSLVQKVVLTK